MEAHELRLGNLVKHKEDKEVIDATIGTLCNIELYEPIPLTEEWLLKFGFEKKSFDMNMGKFKLTASTRIIKEDKLGAFHYKKAGYISTVHQLQNLYFALTGTELEQKK